MKKLCHELKVIRGQHADVRDTTPLEVDEKLPNAMVCNCSFQEASLEQHAHNDVFPHVLKNVKVINQHCSVSANRNWKKWVDMNVSNEPEDNF